MKEDMQLFMFKQLQILISLMYNLVSDIISCVPTMKS